MKEEILKLRNDGKTYNEIVKILGCSKSTVSYHCGKNQKEKTLNRNRKRRNKLVSKTEQFKYKKRISRNIWRFNKSEIKDGNRITNSDLKYNFSWKDVLEKFGENTKCYLTGEDINLFESDYAFDHIIPISRGGENNLENLGICDRNVNQMKSDLNLDEFLKYCIKILEFNGYKCVRDRIG